MDEKQQETLHLADVFPKPSYEDWKEAALKLLKGAPYEKIMRTKTYEGITLEPIYSKADTDNLETANSFPGFFPYVRGTKASGYVKQGWFTAQEIPVDEPAEYNKVLLSALMEGQTMIKLGLNQFKPGLKCCEFKHFDTAFKDVDLSAVPVKVESGNSATADLGLLTAFCQDKETNKLSGNIGMDPIGELVVVGKLTRSLDSYYSEMADLIKWTAANAPAMRIVCIDGKTFGNAGASAVQELGYSLAVAVEYINAMLKRGLNINDIANSIGFSFTLGSNFFMEMSKLRAARILWSTVVKSFDGSDEAAKMNIHAENSELNKTNYDPYVNILRLTTETFSGIMGGADSITVNPFDQNFKASDNFSMRNARNIQTILNEEASLAKVIDPAGGSYLVESLTDTIAEMAWELFKQTEKSGGVVAELKNNIIQDAVKATLQERRKKISIRKDVFVGVNMYAETSQTYPADSGYNMDDHVCQNTVTIHDVKPENAVSFACKQFLNNENFCSINKSIDKAYEDSNEKLEVAALPAVGVISFFEDLRHKVEKSQIKPKIFLATMGPVKQHKARADFSRGFMETAGFEVEYGTSYSTPQEAAEAALASGAQVTVVCSTDPTYPEIVPDFTKAVKLANPKMQIVLAGYPKAHIEDFAKVGVDEFIHVRANAYQILYNLAEKSGVEL